MLLAVAILALRAPDVAQLDAMAKARDVAQLTRTVVMPKGADNPFLVMKTGGPFETGKFGWHAEGLKAPGGAEYAVISTPLTSEDVGEILLKRVKGKWVYIPEADPMGVHLISHDFDLRFDVPTKSAFIQDNLTFRTTGTGDWIFRMSPNYRVSEIRDAYGANVPFQQAGGIVAVPRKTGFTNTYRIRYSGVVDQPKYAGSISESEATLVNDYWYPMVARQPTTYRLQAQAPKGWTVVAQGTRQASPTGSFRYQMNLPVIYFSVIASDFKETDLSLRGSHYRVWSVKMPESERRRHAEMMVPVVEFYRSTLGVWPFAGYGAVDSPNYGGGALEAYSFATYGAWMPSEEPHEPAHTLWGGVINNTYLKSFWNESFAVFCEGLYAREVPIGNRAERRLAYIMKPEIDGAYRQFPLFHSGAYQGPASVSLGYGKGAFVLQMLEQWLGTAKVTQAMRTWLKVQTRAVPGNWEDFERIVIQQNPKQDVRGFFDDWGRRPGFADFGATVLYDGRATVVQLAWKGPRYRMPLTILREYPWGKQKFDTVWLDGKRDSIRLEGPKPGLVSLDPWRQAVRPIAANENPPMLSDTVDRMKKIVEKPERNWVTQLGGKGSPLAGEIEPAGKLLVGSPTTWPLMKSLCDQVGFRVVGNRLSFQGTSVDLDHGGALALVDLPGGKRCAIALGKMEEIGTFGNARLVVKDRLGRVLRAVSEPKRSGKLTYRIR